MTQPLNKRTEWKALFKHWKKTEALHLHDLFAADSQRAEIFSLTACDLFLDYSKNRITAETMDKLVALAEATGLAEQIEAMFTGEKINRTEGRAVLHTALRSPRAAEVFVDGEDVGNVDLFCCAIQSKN